MNTLERLKHLSEMGKVIFCPQMTLIAGDHEPPVVVGEGEITVLDATSFGYTLRGTPNNIGQSLRSLRRIDVDPYDGILRQRLTVTTADGLALMGGWTIPHVRVPDDGGPWVFKGEIKELSFVENGSHQAGTEAAYLLPRQHRARIILRRFFPRIVGEQLPEVRLTVLGSDVVFTLDDEADLLLVRAPATATLPPAFAENWLGEPLRILFGQPAFPRFVVRNSNTWSMGCIRPSPKWSLDSDSCALWQGVKSFTDAEGFWESYRRLLAYVVLARGAEGNLNFEANKITALYGEVAQAAHGSRWVWALTYASAVEAMVKLLALEGQVRADIDATALAKLAESVNNFHSHIDCWEGDARLKEPAKNAAARMLKMSAVNALRKLEQEGCVKRDEFDAWNTLRNRVMHGSLVSPYSSAEEDKLLLALAHLLHALTRRLLAHVDPDAKPPADQLNSHARREGTDADQVRCPRT
jgi:hypothetical protein